MHINSVMMSPVYKFHASYSQSYSSKCRCYDKIHARSMKYPFPASVRTCNPPKFKDPSVKLEKSADETKPTESFSTIISLYLQTYNKSQATTVFCTSPHFVQEASKKKTYIVYHHFTCAQHPPWVPYNTMHRYNQTP